MTQLTTDGRSRRAHEQRESRRARILEAACRVFAAKGYHGTRVADIIESAGIARGTFYIYFEGKSTVFHELLDQLLVELRATVVGVDTGPGAPDVQEQLLGTVTRIVRAVRTHEPLTTIIFREAVGLDAQVDEKLREFYGNLHGFIAESLARGQRLGVVRDLDTQVVASCILGSIKYLMEEQAMAADNGAWDAERVGRAVLDYNLRGVLAD